ncbi:uncharacterized protein [Nicotiana sylvestris]|uniref:uncharacterized protein n=1 Tax=Nicotiana sylvestris TaxID=4096 RepID=UPI00388CEC96
MWSTKASKAAEPVRVEEIQPRTEKTSEEGPSKVPESSEDEDSPCRNEQSVGVPEGAGSEALQNEENAPSDSFGEIEIGDSPILPKFSEGQIQEAQAMGTSDVEEAHGGEKLFRGCLTGAEDATDLNEASSIFDEAQRLLSQTLTLHRDAFSKSRAKMSRCEADLQRLTEERNALKLLTGQKEEEIKDLRAELATSHKEQTDLIKQVDAEAIVAVYRADAEAAQARAKEFADTAQTRAYWAAEHAKYYSRRETLEEIYARFFNLVV